MKRLWFFLLTTLGFGLVVSFQLVENQGTNVPEKLSDYALFTNNLADQHPAPGVIPYQLNTPLFSDYAEKLRFVQLPPGQTVPYNERDVLDFPFGTKLIKTFYYPADFRKPDAGRRLMETRLLIREASGWKALEYIWNDEQTEAFLDVAGDTKPVTYLGLDGKKRQQVYVMPNLNQCKGCHNRNEQLTPIGPSARQLNGDLVYRESLENQLVYWKNQGLLTGMPALSDVPKAPIWNRPETGTLEARARAWLDINCAHCHRPEGPASTSGLNLSSQETNPTALGIGKTPVAAGRGSGNRRFDIVPGHPEESILMYRIESTDPGEMMPEVGRKTTHREGVELIRQWIAALGDKP